MSLNEVKKDRIYIIDQIKASKSLKQKLMNMGLTPGVKIQFIRSSISGNPIAIRVRDYIIALRKEEAKHIIITEFKE